MVIGAPMTADDLCDMMTLSYNYDGPIAIRYPRGRTCESPYPFTSPVEIGKGACLLSGNKIAVLSLGAIGNTVAQAINDIYNQSPISANQIAHYDMRWLKPLDENLLHEVASKFDTIVTVEDGVINGGLGSAILEWLADHPSCANQRRVIRLGVNDQFVEHGSTQQLYHLLKLDKQGICESLLQALEQ
jgi:1-deoxy-D-xylulose-5-phosphate synthase